jgi:NTP pyrophosphatase (non-canonical NTP hydrolase)
VSDVFLEVLHARAAAHAKHGENSIEAINPADPRWLPIFIEEVGEVAEELTYDKRRPGRLRAELIDVLAVAHAWVDAIDGKRTVEVQVAVRPEIRKTDGG